MKLIVMALMLFASCAYGADAVLAPMNNYQAYAYSVQAAHQAKADQCESKAGALKAMAAKCASDICLALFADKVSAACDGNQAAQVAVAQPPAPDRPWYMELKDTVLDIARVGLPVVDRAMASRERRDATASAERQSLGLYSTFSNINGQTAALGIAGFGSIERTATSGFGSMERGMVAGFTAPRDPTYQVTVNGDDNALFGSTSSRSYMVNCASGQAGNGGNSAPGGTGGNTSTNGYAGSGGYNTAGNGAPSGSVPCTIQK